MFTERSEEKNLKKSQNIKIQLWNIILLVDEEI